MPSPTAIPNYNPDHDVYYGIISADRLDPDQVNWLLYENPNSINHSYNAALLELAKARNIFSTPFGKYHITDDDGEPIDSEVYETMEDAILATKGGQSALDEMHIEEPIVEGKETSTNATYISSWLGGALNFFIVESNQYTPSCPVSSPSVPNAGNLDSWIDGNEGGHSAFLPPSSWLSTESHAEVFSYWREVYFT